MNYVEIIKQNNCIKYSKCLPCSAMQAFTPSIMFYATGEQFYCPGNGSPDEILSICLAQKNREMYP
jgi:hypothetical protein